MARGSACALGVGVKPSSAKPKASADLFPRLPNTGEPPTCPKDGMVCVTVSAQLTANGPEVVVRCVLCHSKYVVGEADAQTSPSRSKR